MKALTLLLIILQFNDTGFQSPNGMYTVISNSEELSDANIKINYYFINLSTNDTLHTSTSIIHDYRPPVFIWTKNSNQLIFEERNALNSLGSRIEIYDLKGDTIIFESNGLLNTAQEQIKNYIDHYKNKLYYFESNRYEFKLIQLDLKNFKTQEILSFKHFDINETPQVVTFNKTNGLMEIQIVNKDYNNQQLSVTID